MHSCISSDICQSTSRDVEVRIGVIASAHTGRAVEGSGRVTKVSNKDD